MTALEELEGTGMAKLYKGCWLIPRAYPYGPNPDRTPGFYFNWKNVTLVTDTLDESTLLIDTLQALPRWPTLSHDLTRFFPLGAGWERLCRHLVSRQNKSERSNAWDELQAPAPVAQQIL